MRNAPALHGRDHCPGGADPIPCVGGIPVEWASAEAFIGSTDSISATGGAIGGTIGTGIGDYYYMAHTNADVFGWVPPLEIAVFQSGLYLLTAWLDMGSPFSNYFDMSITIQASSGLLGYWQSQPAHPDARIRTASWTSAVHPQVLRYFQYFRIYDATPATPISGLSFYGALDNDTGVTQATHNALTFGLEIVRLGIPTEGEPIYELGSP